MSEDDTISVLIDDPGLNSSSPSPADPSPDPATVVSNLEIKICALAHELQQQLAHEIQRWLPQFPTRTYLTDHGQTTQQAMLVRALSKVYVLLPTGDIYRASPLPIAHWPLPETEKISLGEYVACHTEAYATVLEAHLLMRARPLHSSPLDLGTECSVGVGIFVCEATLGPDTTIPTHHIILHPDGKLREYVLNTTSNGAIDTRRKYRQYKDLAPFQYFLKARQAIRRELSRIKSEEHPSSGKPL